MTNEKKATNLKQIRHRKVKTENVNQASEIIMFTDL